MIELHNVCKTYSLGDTEVRALDSVSLHVGQGEFVAIMGPSGSGKSTLVNIIGCLDQMDSGSYTLRGEAVDETDQDSLADIRGRRIGFVFQLFNLLPRISARRNVELPMIYRGIGLAERQKRAIEALAQVGLAERAEHTPMQLSGGQQQRVAIARALVNEQDVIIADEPTGSLDTKTGLEIMDIFQKLNNQGKTLLLITHEPDIAAFSRRTIRLRDGRIESDTPT
jgi:putative ABC transport system ATP-binding protein